MKSISTPTGNRIWPSIARVSIVLACCQIASAHVRLAAIFGDHMVLQRGVAIPVWGWADPGENIEIEFQGAHKMAIVDETGRWQAVLGPYAAGGPHAMRITGRQNAVVITDIRVGEVWVCSGQSNMQWPLEKMNHASNEIAKADYPGIRFVKLRGTASEPTNDLWSCKWVVCTSNTAGSCSAPGYFFGRELHDKLKVPIGLIVNAEGSAPIRAWISPETQRANPLFRNILKDYESYPARARVVNEKLAVYAVAVKQAKAAGTPLPPYPGVFEWLGKWPGCLYNARLAPLAPFAIKGAIWWQGENEAMFSHSFSNSALAEFKHAALYQELLPVMIKDWRTRWRQGDFPFLCVQLAPINWGNRSESDWAEVREGQRRALKVKNYGLVVTTDICEADLHPRSKTEVGKRLALAARAIAYGEQLEYSGPIFEKCDFKDGQAILKFTHVGGGLVARGEKLTGFKIAGADRRFVPAQADIRGDTVVVGSDQVPDPKIVRYLWDENPVGNLFNKAGLPASCFRTDD